MRIKKNYGKKKTQINKKLNIFFIIYSVFDYFISPNPFKITLLNSKKIFFLFLTANKLCQTSYSADNEKKNFN